jgi:hypothetical protein
MPNEVRAEDSAKLLVLLTKDALVFAWISFFLILLDIVKIVQCVLEILMTGQLSPEKAGQVHQTQTGLLAELLHNQYVPASLSASVTARSVAQCFYYIREDIFHHIWCGSLLTVHSKRFCIIHDIVAEDKERLERIEDKIIQGQIRDRRVDILQKRIKQTDARLTRVLEDHHKLLEAHLKAENFPVATAQDLSKKATCGPVVTPRKMDEDVAAAARVLTQIASPPVATSKAAPTIAAQVQSNVKKEEKTTKQTVVSQPGGKKNELHWPLKYLNDTLTFVSVAAPVYAQQRKGPVSWAFGRGQDAPLKPMTTFEFRFELYQTVHFPRGPVTLRRLRTLNPFTTAPHCSKV